MPPPARRRAPSRATHAAVLAMAIATALPFVATAQSGAGIPGNQGSAASDRRTDGVGDGHPNRPSPAASNPSSTARHTGSQGLQRNNRVDPDHHRPPSTRPNDGTNRSAPPINRAEPHDGGSDRSSAKDVRGTGGSATGGTGHAPK
ncbi:MAG: hypothetical protein KA795_13945 [Burkholderiaceae bacterium]|nr:hypothetical protein [Burkholderiaceae bacterium]